jgi:hypothetical protein
MKPFFGVFFAAFLISGCACPQSTRILTGNSFPAISANEVEFCSKVPQNSRSVAAITVQCLRNDQTGANAAQDEAKKSAAQVGANRLIFAGSKIYPNGLLYVNFRAYYVAPEIPLLLKSPQSQN